jgi:hypothetical protein
MLLPRIDKHKGSIVTFGQKLVQIGKNIADYTKKVNDFINTINTGKKCITQIG